MATWQPKPEDLGRVFEEQNPWHRGAGAVPDVLAPSTERPLAMLLWRRINVAPRRYQLILGPHRVGKTTAMYQTARRLLDTGLPPTRL